MYAEHHGPTIGFNGPGPWLAVTIYSHDGSFSLFQRCVLADFNATSRVRRESLFLYDYEFRL